MDERGVETVVFLMATA